MWGRVLAGVGYALYLREMGKAGSRRFWKSGCLDHEVPSGAFLAPKSDFVGHGMLWLFPRSTGHSFQLLQHWPLHVVILYLFSPLVSWASFHTWNRVLTFQQSSLLRTWVIGLWVPSRVWLEGFDNSFLSLRGGLPHSDPHLLYWFRFLAYNFFIG